MEHSSYFNYRTLTPEEQSAFKEYGFLIIKQILTDAGLEKMREESMAAWNAEKESFDSSKTWLQNSLLMNIHHKSPAVRNYYFEGVQLYAIGETTCGDDANICILKQNQQLTGLTLKYP